MNTNSPAFLRSMALNSKRACAEKDSLPIVTGPAALRTSHHLFPDGSLLEYHEFIISQTSFLCLIMPLVDDRSISNEFIASTLASAHGALANFVDRAQDNDTLRCTLSETLFKMVTVIHKLHIFSNYWDFLNREYASLKASLLAKAAETVPVMPEVIPLEDGIEI